MNSNTIVRLQDFFDFTSKEPINRLAYTEEDLVYKVKVIEKMQELGMNVTFDKIRKYLWFYLSCK